MGVDAFVCFDTDNGFVKWNAKFWEEACKGQKAHQIGFL